jgi:hypothetical protein
MVDPYEDAKKINAVRENYEFWIRIDSADAYYKQEVLIKEFIKKIEDNCLSVIRERANTSNLNEASTKNEELMNYIQLVMKKSQFNLAAMPSIKKDV